MHALASADVGELFASKFELCAVNRNENDGAERDDAWSATITNAIDLSA